MPRSTGSWGSVVVCGAIAALSSVHLGTAVAAPPEGFVVDEIGGRWDGVAGACFLEDGRAIAWERAGRVWMIHADGTRHEAPMIDISDEVGVWVDHGMLGLAVDPEFMTNGRIYLLYIVDRHHLLNFGTPSYDPQVNEYNAATIGRLTRYQATAESGFEQIDAASRSVLIGETIETGIPILNMSHGVGSLLFGEDGTLLISTGDGASFWEVDEGGPVTFGLVPQALADGIIAAKHDVGAYRAQLVDSLNGKILRIDPTTGDGVPSNPFFDATAPRAARSRVWCLGLRNPFRMELIPETGSHFPVDGDPGDLLIGDVGWFSREEINLATTGGANFGWPRFEGLGWSPAYANSPIVPPNLDAPNPLVGAPSPICGQSHLPFSALLIDDTLDSDPLFVNPCGVHQAENALRSGATTTTDFANFTGTGWVGIDQSAGAWVEWTIPIERTGEWKLAIRYALDDAAPRPMRLSVDGVEVEPSFAFEPSGAWTHARWASITLPLDAGVRAVRLTSIGAGGPLLDGLAVHAPNATPTAIPVSIPRFVHRRPIIDWSHDGKDARVPGFDGARPVARLVGSPESGVDGVPFQGSCAIGGSRIEHGSWPEQWHDMHLFGDYASQFIRGVRIDSMGMTTGVEVFDPLAGPVVFARYNHHDDSLWVVRWGNQLLRIRYAPDTNFAPVIVASATPPYGASPLITTLDASASTDPEGTPLTFIWTFPDGSPPLFEPVVQVRFESVGPARHDVLLTVRDADGVESSKIIPVWTNNTPPVVEITSVHDGDLYSMRGPTALPLEAAISDAEDTVRACAWQTVLHHNTHTHAEPVDPACSTTTLIAPLGCGEGTFFYGISLTVTDPLGLATTQSLFIYPDCNGKLLCPADLNDDGFVDGADFAVMLAAWGQSDTGLPADLDGDGTVGGGDLTWMLGAWGPCP